MSVDVQSETSHYLSLCRGKIGSVLEKLFIARELVDNDQEYYNHGVKNKSNFLKISKALSDALILFDNDFDKAPTQQDSLQ